MLSYMITSYKKGVINIFDVEFYKKSNGEVPVKDFLYSFEPKLREKHLVI